MTTPCTVVLGRAAPLLGITLGCAQAMGALAADRAENCAGLAGTTVPAAAIGLPCSVEQCRRDALAQATARLLGEGLGGRVLPFDRAAAAYGEFVAKRRVAGRPVAAADAQIAATAKARGASLLATRGESGYQECGVRLVNPWDI